MVLVVMVIVGRRDQQDGDGKDIRPSHECQSELNAFGCEGVEFDQRCLVRGRGCFDVAVGQGKAEGQQKEESLRKSEQAEKEGEVGGFACHCVDRL